MTGVAHALTDKASLWLEINEIENYEILKAKFIDEFYSIPIRVRFKNTWNARRYDQKSSLQSHYYSQIKESRYFLPQLSKYEINYAIIQQCPTWIRENLTTIDYNNDAMIGQALASLENIRIEKEKFRENRNQYNHGKPREQNQAIKEMKIYRLDTVGKSHHNRPYNNSYHRQNNRRKYEQRSPRNAHTNIANENKIELPDTRYSPPSNSLITPQTIPNAATQNNNNNGFALN